MMFNFDDDDVPVISEKYEPKEQVLANNAEKLNEADQAIIKKSDAETNDITVNTKLKIWLTIFICIIMLCWIYFTYTTIDTYLHELYKLKNEVPKEVILGIITAGASVIGLMAHILKGLFNS